MDALADVLKTIRLRANTYFCSDFHSPWGMSIDGGSDGLFHVVVSGECWLKTANSDGLLHLSAGDIVAFPTGGSHWISDNPDSPKMAGKLVVERIQDGNNPFQQGSDPMSERPRIRLLCGAFGYDHTVKHPFLRDLPCFIHIKAKETPELNWLRSLIERLSVEAQTPSPGSTIMVDRLTEVLFIQLMRAYVASKPSSMSYLAALSDPQIGKALNLIHDDSGENWTVEKLGDRIAMSRTAFTEKFSKLVGIPPKTYLTDWRMQKAKSQLETTNDAMINVAESAGYSSEAAFSKAFKQYFGATPGKLRRAHPGEAMRV